MRYIFAILFSIFTLPIYASSDFDVSCFRYKATLNSGSGIIGVLVKSTNDDLFFTSGKTLIPSKLDTTEKNPPVLYSSPDSIDLSKLQDSDPQTAIEVDPYLLGKQDVSYIFDLGTVYSKDSLMPNIGYYAYGKVSISISRDGTNYVVVDMSRVSDFDFRYLRITFEKILSQNDVTLLHTVIFYKKIQSRYLVESKGGIIDVYNSFNCQQGKYNEFLQIRPVLSTTVIPTNSISLEFFINSEYIDDTDTDSIPNLQDNCPLVANPDQKDRNRDGLGDACADDDGDGILGSTDNCGVVSNANQEDKNVNGIGDVCEFDSDNDGIPDGVDNAIRISNPDQLDTDKDKIGDVMDNCSLYNPDQLDLDKNNKGDVCDKDEEYRKTNDGDNDGILDFYDNCLKIANPDQLDTDKDKIGDVCDNCKNLQNTDQKDTDKNGIGDACEDTDGDGFDSWRDNCPLIKNSDQKDDDNDGIGNNCEDTDGDTIYDSMDNCLTIYNPEQKNIDTDTFGDVCDDKDDRFLESNKFLFMGLIGFFALLFIGAIVYLIRKLQ